MNTTSPRAAGADLEVLRETATNDVCAVVARLANGRSVPKRLDVDVSALRLSAHAGFILSRIDGATTVEWILSTSPVPQEETFRVLAEFIQLGVITLA